VVAPLKGKAMKKRALNTVVSPVPLVVGLASVDAATPLKKRKKSIRSVWNIVLLPQSREF
jgi:hypothetical protein